jgi:Ca2+-binding EF-hand superfamily protein
MLRTVTLAAAVAAFVCAQTDEAVVFQHADADRNGELERAEVGQLVAQLGKTLSADELDAAMAEMDRDRSDAVTMGEFDVWWGEMRADDLDEDALLFRHLDTNGNGELESDEMRQLVARFGKSLSTQEIDQAMVEMDRDGDGAVIMGEFDVWWTEMMTESDPTAEMVTESDPIAAGDIEPQPVDEDAELDEITMAIMHALNIEVPQPARSDAAADKASTRRPAHVPPSPPTVELGDAGEDFDNEWGQQAQSRTRQEIDTLYQQYNPGKLADVDQLAAKYGEKKLLLMVRNKYEEEGVATEDEEEEEEACEALIGCEKLEAGAPDLEAILVGLRLRVVGDEQAIRECLDSRGLDWASLAAKRQRWLGKVTRAPLTAAPTCPVTADTAPQAGTVRDVRRAAGKEAVQLELSEGTTMWCVFPPSLPPSRPAGRPAWCQPAGLWVRWKPEFLQDPVGR